MSDVRGPTEFLYANEAWTPLAISKVHSPGDSQAYPSKRVYWRWGVDGRFHGPEALAGFEPKGTDGRFVYLEQNVGARQPAATNRTRPPEINLAPGVRLFALNNGGAAQEILIPPASGANFRFIVAAARNGFGPVLLTERPEPGFPQRPLQERWGASGTRVSRLTGYKDLRYIFPRAELAIAANRSALDINDRRTNSRVTVAVPNRDGSSGIESLTLDRFGWLFVENGGADYAIKRARDAEKLVVKHVTEFTGEGWLRRLFSFFFGRDDGVRVDERHFSPQCADQSTVLRLTFFCKPLQVLRNGKLEEIGGSPNTTARWIGDSAGAGVALLSGGSVGLVATDGVTAQRISDIDLQAGGIQDIPAAGRTFVTSGDQAWELVGRYPRLRLRRLTFSRAHGQTAPYHCCLSDFAGAQARFIGLPGTDEVIAINSTMGIWVLDKRHARMIWKASQSAVNLNSVAGAHAWGGLAFLTEDRTPYLLKMCKTSH